MTRPRLALLTLEDRLTPVAGQIDPTFGTNGVVGTDVYFADFAADLVVDAAGRSLIAGTANFSDDFALVRYTPAGALDTTFGTGGIVRTDFGTDANGMALALAPGGKIVVAGFSNNGFAVARYNPNGGLDSTFDTDGKVITPVGEGDAQALAVAVQADGKIVVGGHAVLGGTKVFAVVRYTDTGALDSTFDGDGIALTNVGPAGGDDVLQDLAIQPDGKIIAAGYSGATANTSGFAMARYDTAGGLDLDFGLNGSVVTRFDPGSYAVATRVRLLPDGKIVLAGEANLPHPLYNDDFAIARYLPNGFLDNDWGPNGNGRMSVDFANSRDEVHGLAIDSAGHIVLAGFAYVGGVQDFALARLLPDGAPDPGFANVGKFTRDSGSTDAVRGLALDPAGRIIVGGDYRPTPGGSDFTAIAYDGNDAPVVTPGTGTAEYLAGGPAVPVAPALSLYDPDNVEFFGATVSVGNYRPAEDVIEYTLQPGIAGSFDADTGVLTLSGRVSIADYEIVLRSIAYRNTFAHPDPTPRVFTFTVDDGYVTENLGSGTRTVNVTGTANSSPTFTDDAELAPILQGTAEPPGQKVSVLFRDRFSDPDAGDTLGGVAVVGNPAVAAEGAWQYSTDGGDSWYAVGTVADGPTALALSATTRLRFLPAVGFVGDAGPLTVRPIDSTFTGAYTAGSTRQTTDASVNGETSPIGTTTAAVGERVVSNAGGNTPPTLGGVPVSANVNEGDALTFTATATDPDGQTPTFALVGAPAGASIDTASGAFIWTPTEAQGPRTYVFVVRATDGIANTDQTVTAIVGEVNEAPVLTGVPTELKTVRGRAVTFTPTATDPDLVAGLPNTLTYSLVNAPAGATIDPDTGAVAWTPNGSVPNGTYSFDVRVTDDGVPARNDRETVAVLVSTTLPDGPDLWIGGTDGNDVIAVKRTPDKTALAVTVNAVPVGTYSLSQVTGRLTVYGLAGNDRVTVNGKLTLEADLYGGVGNDTLTGGGGDDVLVGGDGKDILTGGTGRDLLIGGAGPDRLTGGAGDDLLIGSATSFDVDPTGLAAIRSEWTSATTPYADRVQHLTTGGGANGATVVAAATAPDDGSKDTLTGGGDADWFVVSAGDKADRKGTEQVLPV